MTAAILDIRPTLESGVGLYEGGTRSFVPRLAHKPRELHRRRLICRWRLDRGGRLVRFWQAELIVKGSE
jgi:hypothetical protein